MTPSTLHLVAILAASLAGCVFVAAYRFALRERGSDPMLPRAELHGQASGRRWQRGAGKQRVIRHMHVVQAGLVAIGITSVFIMFMCMAGVIAAMLVGSV